MHAVLNEMRKEFGRLAESQGELVKKDECDSRLRSVWRDLGELKDDQKDVQALKERCAALVGARDPRFEPRGARHLAATVDAHREG